MVRLRVAATETGDELESIVERYYAQYDVIKIEYRINPSSYHRYVAFIEYEDGRDGYRETQNLDCDRYYAEPPHDREMLFS